MIKPELDFAADILFVLMNTLYVKDVWNSFGDELDYSLNPEHYFVNSNKKKSEKKLLQGYYAAGRKIETENYSCFHTLTLNGLKLYFVKPNDGKELKSVFNKEAMDYVLGDNYVVQDDAKKERYFTRCIFPEFIADCDNNLKDLLYNDFDIKSIFVPDKCDFTNLSNDDKYHIYCSEVRHITKLDINKKGMEGAAVTIMSMDNVTAAPEPEQYMYIYEDFVVDKEFGFVLTYNDSVLFSGVVNNIG